MRVYEVLDLKNIFSEGRIPILSPLTCEHLLSLHNVTIIPRLLLYNYTFSTALKNTSM